MTIESTDLTRLFGSRLPPLNADSPLDAAITAELRALLAKRRLLLIRQGKLSVEQQMHIVGAFGPVIVEDPSGNPWSTVSNFENCYIPSASERLVFHADYQFTPYGPLQTISLYADAMERGSPTSFTNMVAGLARLPEALHARMAELNVVQLLDLSHNFSEARRSRLSAREPGLPDSQYPHSTQKMIARHRITGEDFINISQMQTSQVDGWDDAASETLFKEMESYIYVPENMYTHSWEEGDLLVWDNIGLQHGRERIEEGARRSLRRVAANDIDVPTMMSDVRPDPERFPSIQWHDDRAA